MEGLQGAILGSAALQPATTIDCWLIAESSFRQNCSEHDMCTMSTLCELKATCCKRRSRGRHTDGCAPAHLQPAYAGLGYCRGAFPQSEKAAKEVLSLPL